jgi:glutaredoxin
MARITMYSTGVCPYCQMAERLLKSKGVAAIDKVRVDLDPQRRVEMMEKTGRRTVPQIYRPTSAAMTISPPSTAPAGWTSCCEQARPSRPAHDPDYG